MWKKLDKIYEMFKIEIYQRASHRRQRRRKWILVHACLRIWRATWLSAADWSTTTAPMTSSSTSPMTKWHVTLSRCVDFLVALTTHTHIQAITGASKGTPGDAKCVTPLLIQPFARTDFAKRSFRCAAPSVWNSLLASVIGSDSLSVFKSRLKTFLFRRYFG